MHCHGMRLELRRPPQQAMQAAKGVPTHAHIGVSLQEPLSHFCGPPGALAVPQAHRLPQCRHVLRGNGTAKQCATPTLDCLRCLFSQLRPRLPIWRLDCRHANFGSQVWWNEHADVHPLSVTGEASAEQLCPRWLFHEVACRSPSFHECFAGRTACTSTGLFLKLLQLQFYWSQASRRSPELICAKSAKSA